MNVIYIRTPHTAHEYVFCKFISQNVTLIKLKIVDEKVDEMLAFEIAQNTSGIIIIMARPFA